MASDAFFPFRDGIDAAAEAGIRAVIQPGGGSMRDAEVIAAADEHGLAMVFTGVRHFRHRSPGRAGNAGTAHEDKCHNVPTVKATDIDALLALAEREAST